MDQVAHISCVQYVLGVMPPQRVFISRYSLPPTGVSVQQMLLRLYPEARLWDKYRIMASPVEQGWWCEPAIDGEYPLY